MMTDRKSYFVSLEKAHISEVSVPDSTEYEILATEDELKQLEQLFNQKEDHEKKAVEFLAKPFNEWGADDERDAYDTKLIDIYNLIYQLGTNETKEKINKMGLRK